MNHPVKKLFTIGLYSIFRLCNLQSQMISINYLFTIPMKHSWFQNGYYKCLSGKFIIAWRVNHKRMDLKRQGIQKIIASLVIIWYIPFFHPNPRRCLHITKLCVVVSVAYLWRTCVTTEFLYVSKIWLLI